MSRLKSDPGGNRCSSVVRTGLLLVLLAGAGSAYAQVTASDCAIPGNDGNNLNVGGVVNTYYPATANAAVAARCISVGSSTGAGTAIAAGDLLLVIQMQRATIDSTNAGNYGDGAGGLASAGVTDYLTAGRYEYVTALGAVGAAGGVGCGAGQIPVRARTAGGGLINAYTSAARSGDTGRSVFQVVRVPQYRNATLTADVSANYWNGSTGAVVALDVVGTLNINGRTVSATGRGFRGGGARQLAGGSGADTDRRTLASNNANGAKGEGIAGTSRFTFDQSTYNPANQAAGTVVDNTDEGYNNGTAARGAPGNAGGGGTDGNPAVNDQNSGGGGGGNGGAGGQGGNAWSSQDVSGGFGGAAFGSGNGGFANTIARLAGGGGGGAGSRNNSTAVQSSGGAGGGVILIQAGIFAGSGSIESDGAQGPTPANDGGGGGGAGGTIVLRDDTGSTFTTLTGYSVRANGAAGTNAWPTQAPGGTPGERHGPGGGGGGGIVWRNTRNAPGTLSATGGVAGITTTANDNYGALPGAAGVTTTFTGRTDGLFPGFECATVPVTLTHFAARHIAAGVMVDFATATETQNVGFRIYTQTGDKRSLLSRDLLPSKSMNAAHPSSYRVILPAALSNASLWLADVDVRGRETLHGPFETGRDYGRPLDHEQINWSSLRADHAKQLRTIAAGKSTPVNGAKAWVRENGVQRITHQALLAAGVDYTGIPAAQIAVRVHGRPVARQITGGSVFGASSAILFHATTQTSLYSDATPYLIERDAGSVQEVGDDSTRAGNPQAVWSFDSARYAPQRQYNFSSPGADPWYADRLLAFAGNTASVDVPLALDSVAQLPRVPAQLRVQLIGATDWPGLAPDHRVNIRLDGALQAQLVADGLVAFGHDGPIGGALSDGNRVLRIEASGDAGYDFDVVNVESAELEFPRLPVARDGRWSAALVRTAPIPDNAYVGSLPSAQGGDQLFESGFEAAATTDSGAGSFAVRGLPTAEVIAWRANGAGWVSMNDVRIVASGSTFDAYVPLVNPAAAHFVGSLGSLSQPALEPLETPLDITSGSAQYLAIAPLAFHAALEPLLAAKRAQGLSTALVDVAQIYRQYGASVPTAHAIADYIRAISSTRNVRYVLLAGGDTYDYNDYLGIGSISFVPTLYAAVGEVVRFAPADALFGDLDADGIPELAVGRLPARSVAELQSAVAKVLSYSSATNRDALMVAGALDSATSFKNISDDLALALPGDWAVDRAYVDDLGAAGARNLLLERFGRGPALVSFFGHSAPSQWTFDPIFTAADARVLGNAGKPGIVLQWGCWNTYFVSPSANTLGHALLLSGDRGAAAAFGATTLTTVSSHQALAAAMIARLRTGSTLGEVIIQAKREIAQGSPARGDVIIGTALLGDPAMPLH